MYFLENIPRIIVKCSEQWGMLHLTISSYFILYIPILSLETCILFFFFFSFNFNISSYTPSYIFLLLITKTKPFSRHMLFLYFFFLKKYFFSRTQLVGLEYILYVDARRTKVPLLYEKYIMLYYTHIGT